MRTITDLHIHSPYSRACSKRLHIPDLAVEAERKGVQLMSTGDFTHPAWVEELEEQLEETAPGAGIFKWKGSDSPTRFILGGEISCIYKRGGVTRRIHCLFFLPSFEDTKKMNALLEEKGFNIRSDGRPILGLDVEELAKLYLNLNERALIIPAHIWTPWFSLFGAKSGFDHMEECFGSVTKHIFAVETGLSSDPPMNWRLSQLDNIALISNSDAHSPEKIGREATELDLPEMTYDALHNTLKTREGITRTIEFYPEEGRYHFSGHRKCNVTLDPRIDNRDDCPECKTTLTLGTLHRVNEIADQESSAEGRVPFTYLVPLDEVVSEAVGVGPKSKKVRGIMDILHNNHGSELDILTTTSLSDLNSSDDRVAEAIRRMREGRIKVTAGYDGVYGKVSLFSENGDAHPEQQNLFSEEA